MASLTTLAMRSVSAFPGASAPEHPEVTATNPSTPASIPIVGRNTPTLRTAAITRVAAVSTVRSAPSGRPPDGRPAVLRRRLSREALSARRHLSACTDRATQPIPRGRERLIHAVSASSPTEVRAARPAQPPSWSDHGCPLDTARARCLWHVGGTAGEDAVARTWRRRLPAGLERVRLVPGDHCIVDKSREARSRSGPRWLVFSDEL
jgi:hypothetical protein